MVMTNGTIKALSDLDAAYGWKAPGSEPDLRDLLQEVQGIRVSKCAGAAASALVKLFAAGGVSSGTADNITSSDVILAAVQFATSNGAAAFQVSLRGDCRVSNTTGYVKFTASSTANQSILVFWMDKTGYIAQ